MFGAVKKIAQILVIILSLSGPVSKCCYFEHVFSTWKVKSKIVTWKIKRNSSALLKMYLWAEFNY